MNLKTETPSKPIDRNIPLEALRFGHDPLAGPVINARSSGRLDRIDEMEGMIRAHGLIYPLLVVENPTGKKESAGLFFVFGGNRRLAALQRIYADSTPQFEAAQIPCKVYPSTSNAFELSLAENNTLPLHPVDRFRGFAEIIRREKIKPAEAANAIANRFGLPTKEARRALALGELDDFVLDEWLQGTIDADAAKVLTLCATKADQVRVLKGAIKGGRWSLEAQSLRNTIVGAKKDVGHLVTFIGIDAYRKAGGDLTEDLFGSSHVVNHPQIATKLARDKLDEMCRQFNVAQGWLWASREEEMPRGWEHSLGGFERLPVPKTPKMMDDEKLRRAALQTALDEANEADDYDRQEASGEELDAFDAALAVRAYSDVDKKKSGVVLSVTSKGTLKITAGVVRPEEAKKAREERKKADRAKTSTEAEKNAAPKESAISAALATRLSTALTVAAANALESATTDVKLRIACAGLAARGIGPVNLEHKGLGSRSMDDDFDFDAQFREELAKVNRLKGGALVDRLCVFVAASFDMTTTDGKRVLADPGVDESWGSEEAALAHALPPKALQGELRKAFDAADYFANAPKAFAFAALSDMKVLAPKNPKAKALADMAAEHAAKTGWLPPQLRTKGYEGPALKAAPKRVTKKVSKRKTSR